MTPDQRRVKQALAFERSYAARSLSGITVERLRALGRIVAPCACDSALCSGWQSISRENWDDFARLQARLRGAWVESWQWPPPDPEAQEATGP